MDPQLPPAMPLRPSPPLRDHFLPYLRAIQYVQEGSISFLHVDSEQGEKEG